MLNDLSQIRSQLKQAVAADRRDAMMFSILTVILTPVFIALSILAILWAIHFSADDPWYGRPHAPSLQAGMAFGIFVLFIGFFSRPKSKAPWTDFLWVGAALATYGILLLWSFGSGVKSSQ